MFPSDVINLDLSNVRLPHSSNVDLGYLNVQRSIRLFVPRIIEKASSKRTIIVMVRVSSRVTTSRAIIRV